MTQWMQQLLWHSLAMACTILAYWAATAWLRRRYAAKWLYLAGIILLVGLLIPYRPALPIHMAHAPDFLLGITGQASTIQAPAAAAAEGITDAFPQGSAWRTAFYIWAGGVLGMMVHHGIRHLRFSRAVRRWRTAVVDRGLLLQFEAAKAALGLAGHDIRLAQCACISGPMLLRLGRPTILLPQDMEADDNTFLILLHELVHHRRGDLLVRLLMLVTTAMHWFNPAVYLLVRLVTLQCEISCDEKVVENRDMDGRHQYAMSIIGVARGQSRSGTLLTTQFYGGKDTMKKRISAIYEPAKRKMGVLLLACAMLMTMLAGTSLAALPDATEFDYTLPETAIEAGKTIDSYVVTWAPIEGIKEYRLGMYFQVHTAKGEEFWAVGGGWVGALTVEDGKGNRHDVEDAVWESVTVPGDATEADMTKVANFLMENEEIGDVAKILGAKLTVVGIREEGAPLQVTIDVPVA